MAERLAVLCGLTLAVFSTPDASGQERYRKPPQAVSDILNAPTPPGVSVSPTGEYLLFISSDRYPPIADLAEPILRLAGLRINPRSNGPARAGRVTALSLMRLPDGKAQELPLPPGKIGRPIWSPNGQKLAITVTDSAGISLWVTSIDHPKFTKLPGITLNAAIGEAVQWMPDNRSLLVQLVVPNRGAVPASPLAPAGPIVQEGAGKAAPVRTFQDMLHDSHDEALFEYYCTSQLAIAQLSGDAEGLKLLGTPSIVTSSDPSPDGEFILVSRRKRPFSYSHPYSAFPEVIEVLNRTGEVAQVVSDRPLRDKVPIEGVPTGPRAVRWMPTNPHTLVWVEALDDGDPRNKVPHRDALYTQAVGNSRGATELVKLEHRFAGLEFFPSDNRMLVRDFDRERKWSRTILASSTPLFGSEPRVLWERSSQDRYGDPGTPQTRLLPNGHRVLRTAGDVAGNTLWLSGSGASPQGDRPFLDRLDITKGTKERIFHCAEGLYEDVDAILNPEGTKLLIRRESTTEPPNLYYRDALHEKKLTENVDPAPELRKAAKSLIRAKRPDGVEISITLYLPAGHKKGEALPAVLYAYPVEFASASDAGQVTGSTHRFTVVSGYSHLFFLTQGYAVLEVSMPIVGPPAKANDTFIEQLSANAKTAIDAVAATGAVDPTRVGVMGHSYGAFMTANLLAHTDYFRAGIARSGAYNRTLTPFGFQNERRTFWEAPEIYGKMSPFYHAEKINEPLLLIHGEADNNPGTFPVQSERLYQAVRGNGGTTRLVMLPHEAHGYLARESIEHVLFEQISWFDKYVKNVTEPKKSMADR